MSIPMPELIGSVSLRLLTKEEIKMEADFEGNFSGSSNNPILLVNEQNTGNPEIDAVAVRYLNKPVDFRKRVMFGDFFTIVTLEQYPRRGLFEINSKD